MQGIFEVKHIQFWLQFIIRRRKKLVQYCNATNRALGLGDVHLFLRYSNVLTLIPLVIPFVYESICIKKKC